MDPPTSSDPDPASSGVPSGTPQDAIPTGPLRTPGTTDVFERLVAGPILERAGETIGPYTLLRIIGEGGFGVVWLAERREPMVQRVALKIIKPGMDSREVLARFEQERQALAVMDHPNVARVLDGGVTPNGRPYFAMEYVQGEPITAYCDRHRLRIRERLQLFIPVCEAVQHAHQKGLIHRDIKPSNILVASHDDKPAPKVIDFGIAKAIGPTMTDKTIFTERGVLIGTPEYMSPEQADTRETDIDTRTDVYALGVVLYELLTGVLPFDSRELRSRGFAEIQRIIREDEPPTPSRRLNSLAEAMLLAIATSRQAERNALERELRRELEWIPLKAMRKERARRYESPRDLARDVERYLAGMALEAGPESRSYRARKFVRRNRGAVTAAGLVVTSVVAGGAIAAWRWQLELAARRDAQTQRDAAYALIEFVDRNVLRRLGGGGSGAESGTPVPVPKASLDQATSSIRSQFGSSPDLLARLRAVFARTYLVAGYSRAALDQTESLNLGDLESGDPIAVKLLGLRAEASYRERAVDPATLEAMKVVLSRAEQGSASPTHDMIDLRNQYAGALKWSDQFEAARAQYERVVSENVAAGAERVGHAAAAEYDLVLTEIRILRRDQGTLAKEAFAGGMQTQRERLLELARKANDDAENFGPEHEHTLSCRVEAAGVLAAVSRYDEAIAELTPVVSVMDEALGVRHGRTAEARGRLGQWLNSAKRPAEAEAVLRSAARAMEFAHGAANIDVLRLATSLAVSLGAQSRHEEESAVFEAAFEKAKAAGATREVLATAASWRNRMLSKRNDPDAARWAEIAKQYADPNNPRTTTP